jgi:hypothetical protein
MVDSLKAMTDAGFRAMKGGVDLTCDGRFGQYEEMTKAWNTPDSATLSLAGMHERNRHNVDP